MTDEKELLRVANDSGFPFQIAVSHAVESETATHGWKVAHTEHAWGNIADGKSGFIDLVLRDRPGFVSLVIECKRVRNTSWLFLNTKGIEGNRRHCKSWVTHYRDGKHHAFGWHDIAVDPASSEANFCAVRGQSTNDKNTFLERISGDLVSSTEALALEERDYRPENSPNLRMYFNVIVTTATLIVAEFEKDDLCVKEGVLNDSKFKQAPYVRVRKQFSMRPARLTPEDWLRHDDPDYRRENTVFVVNAENLSLFLNDFNIPSSSLRSFDGGHF